MVRSGLYAALWLRDVLPTAAPFAELSCVAGESAGEYGERRRKAGELQVHRGRGREGPGRVPPRDRILLFVAGVQQLNWLR